METFYLIRMLIFDVIYLLINYLFFLRLLFYPVRLRFVIQVVVRSRIRKSGNFLVITPRLSIVERHLHLDLNDTRDKCVTGPYRNPCP